ncbi:MAG: polysaccharide deacetylase family protein [Solirubrobacterales bacterium]|nr:polysaccharide deacetylase family protein [Solirubrobacterales bacterium]
MRAPLPASASKLNWLTGSLHGIATVHPLFALTFDDGPDQVNTPEILRVLADREVQATFFVTVERAREMPEIVTDTIAAGHEIALHCYWHADLTKSSLRAVVAQIYRARSHLEQLTGREVRFFRPPYGSQNVLSYVAARAAGLEVVVWNASPRDFLALELERQVAVAIKELSPGGIMLLHDGGPPAPRWRRQLLCRLLDEGDSRGWKPLTVSELLGNGQPVRRPWFRRRAQTLIEEMEPFLLSAEPTLRDSIEATHAA